MSAAGGSAAGLGGALRAALDQASDAVLITDAGDGPEGPVILYANAAFRRMTGWDADSLSGRNPKVLQGPETSRRELRRVRAALAAGGPYEGRIVNYRRDGGPFLMAWRMAPHRDASGRVTHWVAHQRDVTEDAARAARLAETEAMLGDIADHIPGALFRYVLRPDGTDAIEYMSRGCAQLWELSAEEIRGDPSALWRMIEPEDFPAMRDSVVRSAETLTLWRHDWRIVTPSGKRRWVRGMGRPRRLEDGATLWNSLILDVTELREAQAALVESREMFHHAQKLEAVGRLVGGVAHDFNNILAVTLGNLELLEEDMDAPERDACVADALSAARRGRDLTRSLLSFARKAPLDPRPIDLNAAIREVDRLLRRVLPDSIKLETAMLGGLWTARVDRASLETALLNLVVNARDAMPEGGTITIETANVRLDADYMRSRRETLPPGRHVMVAVTDTGAGIDPAIRSRVIEPFFTTKARGEGSGLGLSMVDGFVRQSGGALQIYSEPGEGAAVKLYFPAVDAAPAADAPPPPAPGAGETPAARILLVEDEPEVRAAAAARLRRAGHAVTEAETGDAAAALFAEAGPFDLLLTDIVMPGALQGPHLARELRETAPDLPVVFMSGYPEEAAVNGNGLRPEDVKLMKPVDGARLLEAVARALAAARRPDRA